MPIWHIDVLRTPTRTVDIGLIRDEANEAAPNRGLRVEVQLLGENLADTVEQAQGSNQFKSELTGTTPIESILGTSTTISSSPSVLLVSIARVQKLEAQMDTLLYHI